MTSSEPLPLVSTVNIGQYKVMDAVLWARVQSIWQNLAALFVQQSWINQALCLATLTLCLGIAFYMRATKGVCASKAKLHGKTALVTGANWGIGLETARDLAARGARVILAVRNMEKGIEAAKDIVKTTANNNLMVRKLDLASIEETRKFAQQINDTEKRLDILVLNAGMALTRKYLTEDNLELHMASNHFGHFLLTNLLLPLLCETSITKGRLVTDPVRIVTVSSIMHWCGKIELDNLNSERYFAPSRIYGDTKLANLLFTFELNRKLKSEGYRNVIVNAVQTNWPFGRLPMLGGSFIKLLLLGWLYYSGRCPEDGAPQTAIHCAVSEEMAHISGAYFSNCKVTKSSPDSLNEDLAKGLWAKSAQIVDLMPHETVVWN